MTEAQLTELFRQALRASLAATLVGCGSSSGTTDGGPSETSSNHGASDAGNGADSGRSSTSSSASTSAPRPASSSSATSTGGGRDAAAEQGVDAGPCAIPPQVEAECTGGNGGAWDIPITCADGGVVSESDCPTVCRAPAGSGFSGCGVVTSPDSGMRFITCRCATNGRAYAGMRPPEAPGQTTALGQYLAMTAEFEAASVDAFAILEAELRAHDAPADLVVAAQEAARDEVRHAEVTARLARRHGPVDVAPAGVSRVPRSLEEMAVENTVEGCVRETYAALLAHHQAAVAEDVEIREAMAVIARDETRHAALAWSVAAWAADRLDHSARIRVDRALVRAASELREAIAVPPPASVTRHAGIPGSVDAGRMFDVLDAALWSVNPRG